jgi:hypothetical protein
LFLALKLIGQALCRRFFSDARRADKQVRPGDPITRNYSFKDPGNARHLQVIITRLNEGKKAGNPSRITI